jgi:adenosylcobinamide kinase / adenosylcobinamide-phosphate guanylyltransferase
MNYLVTGGARSGKSTHAESLVSGKVTFIAPGPQFGDDPEWQARVLAHQSARAETWTTVESAEVVEALTQAEGPVIIDCLGTWLTALIESLQGWEQPEDDWVPQLRERVDVLAQAVQLHPHDVVLVTNEVGMGLVPEYRSGRLFRDLLGWANQRIASSVDEVHVVIAGRVLAL